MSVRVIEKARRPVVLLAPDVDVQFSEGGAVEWAVAKPANLKKSHGVDITEKRLQEMADAYDPENIEAAPLNFDHEPGGPAHGWVRRAFVRDSMLWVEPIDLSDELVEGIKGGRYKRASIEITTGHPETGGWYLNGLAVLGNAKPAIKALPQLRLAESCHVLDLTGEPIHELTPLPAPTASDLQEGAMPEQTKAPQGGAVERSFRQWLQSTFGGARLAEEAEQEEKQAAMKPAEKDDDGATKCPTCEGSGWVTGAPEESPAEADEKPVEKAAASAKVKVDTSEVASALAQLTVVRDQIARMTVDTDLAKFQGKATPAAISKAKSALLKAKVSGDDETYAVILDGLEAQDSSHLLTGEIAGEAQTSAGKAANASQRQALLDRSGIDAKREAELVRRYGIQ